MNKFELSAKGFDLIVKYETGGNINKYLSAYLDPVGIPTIGIGSTFYEDGKKVKIGDTITKERAISLFNNVIKSFQNNLKKVVKQPLNQNQQDALISLTYNIGSGAFNGSTLLRIINQNPNDATIKNEFAKWRNGTINGKKTVLAGLVKRREAEANLYFSNSSYSLVKGLKSNKLNIFLFIGIAIIFKMLLK